MMRLSFPETFEFLPELRPELVEAILKSLSAEALVPLVRDQFLFEDDVGWVGTLLSIFVSTSIAMSSIEGPPESQRSQQRTKHNQDILSSP